MRRLPLSKMQVLEARHPGLREKVHTMFEEFWPTQAVVQMLESSYGERLSLRSIERYKRLHWQAQRQLVQEMSAVIGRSGDRMIGPLSDIAIK